MSKFEHDCVEAVRENDFIVIRISKNYITKVAVPAAFDGISGYEDARVVDTEQLASDVLSELNREAEDGTTQIHIMLDQVIRSAFENGSEAFEG